MRKFIDIVAQSHLCEARLYSVEIGKETVRVWKNPSHRDFSSLLDNIGSELRGIVDTRGDLYLFDAYSAIHYQVAQALAIDTKFEVILQADFLEGTTPGKAEIVPEDVLIQVPSLARAYGPWAFEQPQGREMDADRLFMEGKKKKKKKHPHKRAHTSFFGYVYGMPAYGVGGHACSQPSGDSGGGDADAGDSGGGGGDA